MRTRWLPWAALVAVALVAPAARTDEAASKPAVVVRAASIDGLLADLRFLAEAAGKEDEVKNLEGLLKTKIGDKGLEGIDPARPIGLYAYVGSAGVDSTVAVLVPIADEKAFLSMVEKLTGKEPANAGGLYSLDIPNTPVPTIYFRFANKYLYATARDKEILDKDKLLDPAEVLGGGKDGALAATIRIDRIPAELKNMVLGPIDLHLAKAKEKGAPDETPAQAQLRTAVVDEVSARIKSLLREGGPIDLRVDVDRKARELSLSLSLAGKPGSPLANSIRDLDKVRTVGASLVSSNSAMGVMLDLSLPAKLRAALGPVIDETEKKALEKAKAKGHGDLAAALMEAIKPTIQNAELDAGFDVRGPGAGGKYTLLAGLRVKDAEAIDKMLHKVAASLPADQKGQVKMDFEKVDKAAIHRITPEKVDPEVTELLGDNPFYLAVREDAVLVAAGEKGLEALKEALGTAPKEGKVFQVEMSMAHLAPLMERENKGATEIAKKVFAKDKDGDKVVITLSGGDALKLRVALKTPLLQFFTLLDEARKPGQ